jgi:hypothetical protein
VWFAGPPAVVNVTDVPEFWVTCTPLLVALVSLATQV